MSILGLTRRENFNQIVDKLDYSNAQKMEKSLCDKNIVGNSRYVRITLNKNDSTYDISKVGCFRATLEKVLRFFLFGCATSTIFTKKPCLESLQGRIKTLAPQDKPADTAEKTNTVATSVPPLSEKAGNNNETTPPAAQTPSPKSNEVPLTPTSTPAANREIPEITITTPTPLATTLSLPVGCVVGPNQKDVEKKEPESPKQQNIETEDNQEKKSVTTNENSSLSSTTTEDNKDGDVGTKEEDKTVPVITTTTEDSESTTTSNGASTTGTNPNFVTPIKPKETLVIPQSKDITSPFSPEPVKTDNSVLTPMNGTEIKYAVVKEKTPQPKRLFSLNNKPNANGVTYTIECIDNLIIEKDIAKNKGEFNARQRFDNKVESDLKYRIKVPMNVENIKMTLSHFRDCIEGPKQSIAHLTGTYTMTAANETFTATFNKDGTMAVVKQKK
jgi:hypothetical protein